MLPQILDRVSFWALFLVIVLLPLFVLPFTNIPIEVSKGLLVVAGLTLSVVFWTMARFFDGEIILPKSYLLLSGFGVVVIFFLSAILSAAPEASLFGAMLDVGSFWFMLVAFLLMLFSSLVVLGNSENAKNIFLGTIISSFVVLLFQILHLFFPTALSLGVLPGKLDNLFGSWNSLGILAGFSSVISLFLVEFFSMSPVVKWSLGGLIVFSTVVVAAVNFPFVWGLLGVSALLIFVYKISFYSKKIHEEEHPAAKADFPIFSLLVMMASLLFFISGQFIGGYIPNRLGLSNIDIRPTLQTTAGITKSVILQDPVLGLGPNKFSNAWAMHKPTSINASSFWDTTFNSGSGLIPTLISTTGILGFLALAVFFCLFLVTGLKSLFATLQHGTNQEITAFFVGSLYLFVSSFFYPSGMVVILLAFAFAGIFVGLSSATHKKGQFSIMFLQDPRKGFMSIMLLVVMMITSTSFAFKYFERFASVSRFRTALSAQTIPEAEQNIGRAVALYPNDLYLRTYALIYILKLNSIAKEATTASPLSEEKKAELQQSFNNAVNGALVAVAYDKENFTNYKMLGFVYESAAPFSSSETYKNALDAYQKASELNPANPGIKLDLARVSFAQKNFDIAKDYANQALALKANYIDAFLVLSQIALGEGSRATAVSYAEKALALAPANKDLQTYLSSLKKGSTPSAPTVDEEKESDQQ